MAIALAGAGCEVMPEGAVELAGRDWRAKAGFAPDDRFGLSQSESVAFRPPIQLGARFPGGGDRVREYAVSVTFHAGEIAPAHLMGLYLRSLGQSADVYLNGDLVSQNIALGDDGALAHRRLKRRWLLPLPAASLRPGVNTLALRVAGDPPAVEAIPNFLPGLHHEHGYYVGPYDALVPTADDWLAIAQVGFYVAFALFAFWLAVFAGGPPVVMLGVFSLLMAVYVATRAAFVVDAFYDTALLRRAEFVAVNLAAAAFFLFFGAVIRQGRAVTRTLAVSWIALAVAGAALPFTLALLTLHLWQVSVLVGFTGVAFALGRALREGDPDAKGYVPGLALLSAAVAWDVAASLTLFTDVRLTAVAMVLFVGTLGANLASRFLRIHREAEAAHGALRRAQDRLAGFYNATLEAICLREGNFMIDVNPAFTRLFGYTADEAAGMPFASLFSAETRGPLASDLTAGKPLHEATAVTKAGATFAAEIEHRDIALEGRTVRVTAVRDVTQRKAAEAQLREQNRSLEQMNAVMIERELRMIELKKELRARKASSE